MNLELFKENIDIIQQQNILKIKPEFFLPLNYTHSILESFINSIKGKYEKHERIIN